MILTMKVNSGKTARPGTRFSLVAWLALLWSLTCSPAMADENIAALYPLVREPYASIYRDLLRGLDQGYPGRVVELGLNGEVLVSHFESNMSAGTQAIVALGGKSYEAMVQLETELPLFATVTKLEGSHRLSGGILLEPEADIYLSRLLDIHPRTARVHVVYNPERHQKLIDQAKVFLDNRDIAFNYQPAGDLRSSALAFRDLVKGARDGDAVWLISDPRLIDGSLLSLVLDVAWEKHLAVFTSNPVFVKRGALFAIYPDNFNIGMRLGTIVADTLQGRRKPGQVESMQDVDIAYNERAGKHIGIELRPETRERIELFLPEM